MNLTQLSDSSEFREKSKLQLHSGHRLGYGSLGSCSSLQARAVSHVCRAEPIFTRRRQVRRSKQIKPCIICTYIYTVSLALIVHLSVCIHVFV